MPGDASDCFSQMLKLAQEAKLPELQRLQDGIAIVEKRSGKSVRDHVGFGKILKVFKNSDGDVHIGEFNQQDEYASNQLSGRGIEITRYGNICIKRWD